MLTLYGSNIKIDSLTPTLSKREGAIYLYPNITFVTMDDILGQAIYDFSQGRGTNKLWIHNQYGPREEMPVAIYFRDDEDMPDLEWLALEKAEGKILDIGAGAGSHALLLQNEEKDVTALEISPLAVKVLQERGIEQVIEGDIYTFSADKYHTLLLLMNGIGLAGTLDGLRKLLVHLKTLLDDGGCILFDSSDVAYLFEGNFPTDHYYGEIAYQYEYKKQKGEWFNWLYVDEHTMMGIADETGFEMEVLLEDEHGQYLAKLTAK